MLVIALPLALVASRLFAAVFDLPFQRHKSWSALLTAAKTRWVSRSERHGASESVKQERRPADTKPVMPALRR